MKSVTEFHREGLEQALRQALGTSQPALRRQALERASSHLIHPRLVLDSPLLSDNHPWRREALAVADAFEAVTNGMEEPGVLAALDDLADDSPFQPWRHLTLALHFFYEGLDEAVAAHLGAIPESSPVATLAAVLSQLTDNSPRPAGAAPARLIDQVVTPDPRILPWVQDIAEGLETDHEALFWGALTDWLEVVSAARPERAQAAFLWAWNQLEWRDFDEQVLLDLGAGLWGRADSYRLAALGTLSWDAEGAALLWLRFLLTAVRDGWDDSVVFEARNLLDRFHLAALEASPPPEWLDTWRNLGHAWNAEATLRGWPQLTLAVSGSPPPPPRSSTGQLDLFA